MSDASIIIIINNGGGKAAIQRVIYTGRDLTADEMVKIDEKITRFGKEVGDIAKHGGGPDHDFCNPNT